MSEHLIIFEAIARQLCVSAEYNRVTMRLAPHIIYMRNDAMHMDAVALEKNGAPPRELKLGTFKLDGLRNVALLDIGFDRLDGLFTADDPRYRDSTLLAVE